MGRKFFGGSAKLGLAAAAVFMSCAVGFANEVALTAESVMAAQVAEPSAPLRIEGLIPDSWFHRPIIEPAIPADYEMWYDKEVDTAYWGRKSDLEKLAQKKPLTIQAPVIQVALSGNVVQTGPNSFSDESPCKKEFRQIGMSKLKTKKMRCGDYPLINLQGEDINGRIIRMAHLGLNVADGWVMRFFLITPPTASKAEIKAAEKQHEKLWHTFLTKTRQLEDIEACRAAGTDIQEGVTYEKTGPVKIKFIGERRRSDGHIAVFSESISPGTTFSLTGFYKQEMPFKWKHGAPGVHLFGVAEQSIGNVRNTINTGVFVLLKDVDEHSFIGENILDMFWPEKNKTVSVEQKTQELSRSDNFVAAL